MHVVSDSIYNFFLVISKWFGLVPYEIYVIPGMFIAMITMLAYDTFDPVQLHLLPHWFAYSMGQYVKTHFKQKRPGCELDERASEAATTNLRSKLEKKLDDSKTKTINRPDKSGQVFNTMVQNVRRMVGKGTLLARSSSSEQQQSTFDKFFRENPTFVQKYTKKEHSNITENHCEGKTAVQSFPSGHTLIAFALATSLIMFLLDPMVQEKEKTFLGIPFYKKEVRIATISLAAFVATMTSVHRVLHDYHSFVDVIAGAIIGMSIGFISYHICNRARRVCQTYASKMPSLGTTEKIIYQIIKYIGIALCTIGLMVSILYDMPKAGDLLH